MSKKKPRGPEGAEECVQRALRPAFSGSRPRVSRHQERRQLRAGTKARSLGGRHHSDGDGGSDPVPTAIGTQPEVSNKRRFLGMWWLAPRALLPRGFVPAKQDTAEARVRAPSGSSCVCLRHQSFRHEHTAEVRLRGGGVASRVPSVPI